MVGLADLHLRFPLDLAIAHDVGFETRDIDDNEIGLDIVEHPARTFEVDPNLVDPGLDRHVHSAQGGRSDDAVAVEPVACLELAYAGLETIVVHIATAVC